MKRYFFILIILALTMPAHAGEEVCNLTGKVLNKGGQPVESAYIEIDSAKDKSLLGYGLSDSSGRFTIRVQKATDYVIKISHISYQTYEKNCFYGDKLVFILEEKINEVSEVTVTANMNKALEMKNGALVFNPSVLGNVGTDNLSGLLKKLPSIQVSANGIAMNGRAVSVYINGRKRELPGKSLAALLNTIPADRIKEISIYPGATGMDSASETGRVNIELKRVKDDLYVSARGELDWRKHGWYGNEAIFFMYNRGKFSMDANLAYYNYYTHANSDWRTSYTHAPATSFFRYSGENREHNLFGDLNLAWDLASNHKLYASFNSFYDKGKGNTLSDLELSADTYEDRTDGYTHRGYTDDLYTANIEFSSNKDKNNRHNISYSYIWGKARNTADTEETKNGIPSRISTRNHHNGGQHQLKYDYRYKFNSYSNFHAGVRTDFGELKPYSDINPYRPTDTVYLNGYHIQENLYAAYVNFDYKTGAFHWLLGLRGEYSDFSARSVEAGISVDYRRLHLFPAMSINWKCSPMADFSLQLSSGIDRPPFLYYVPNYRYSSEYSISVGNPALEPAKYYSINLLSFLFDFLSIQLSYSLTTDKYETVSRMGDTEFQNISTYDNLYDAHKLKFEINCPYLFWNNRISGNIGILGTRSFFRNFANDIAGMGNKESGLLITNFTQIDVTKQLNIGYNLLYQSKSHFSQATMNPMFKLDIEAAYRIKDFTLGFNVNDIFNTYTPRTIYKFETGTSVVNRNNFSPSFNFVLKYAIGKEQTRKTHSGADASRFK